MCLVTLVSVGVSAQKVKTKKGIIVVEDVEVAQIEKREDKKTKEKTIVFYDMDRQDSVQFRKYLLAPQQIYYGITTSLVSDTADMKLEMLAFTLNEEKALTELLIKKHKFFATNGYDKQVIKDYIANQTEKEIPKAIVRIAEEKVINAKIDAMQLGISETWNMTRGGKVIGKIANAQTTSLPQNNQPILFVDSKGNEFARVIKLDLSTGIATIQSYDKKTFDCSPNTGYMDNESRDKFLTTVMRTLAQEEYLPGQDQSVEMAQAAKQDGESAAFRAKTLVKGELVVKGYAPQFGFYEVQFRQVPEGDISEFKKTDAYQGANADGLSLTYFDGSARKEWDGKNAVDLSERSNISADKCDVFIINEVRDADGTVRNIEEAYGVVEFASRFNDKLKKITIPAPQMKRFALILTPKNYITLYKFKDMYILAKDSLCINGGKSMARDFFTQDNLLEFAKDYPAMVEKLNTEHNYLNGEEGLKQFSADMDKVVIAAK